MGHLRAGGHRARGRRANTDLWGEPLRYNSPDVMNRNGLVASNGVFTPIHINQLAPLLADSPHPHRHGINPRGKGRFKDGMVLFLKPFPFTPSPFSQSLRSGMKLLRRVIKI